MEKGSIMPGEIAILKIIYNVNEPEKSTIKTNIKKDSLVEILETWLCCQIGQGADKSNFNIQEEYTITIKLDLSNDTFSTNSDTRNKALTCGIIADILRKFGKIKITGI